MRRKRLIFSLIAILSITILIVGCSSSGSKDKTELDVKQLNVAVNMPQDLTQSITDDVTLTELRATVTNLSDPDEQYVETKEAAAEVGFQFNEVREGHNYEVTVRAKDEAGYWVYKGSKEITITGALGIKIEPQLLKAPQLAFKLDNLGTASTGEVMLVDSDFRAEIDFSNNYAEFKEEIPANDYTVVIKQNGADIKSGELSLYPGRPTVATIDMACESRNVGEIETEWEEPRDDFTAPYVKTSLEPDRYETAQTTTLEIEDDQDDDPQLYYTTDGSQPTQSEEDLYQGEEIKIDESMKISTLAVDAAGNKREVQFRYYIGPEPERSDFRNETIYFVMTSRFYDGDPNNNTHCWAGEKAGNVDNDDPAWRGDFAGLIEKLDYIKALGFSAIWITPPVKNYSGYDYHGYHAGDFTEIDPRYESPGATYQDLIDAVHSKDMKIIQDVVFNHSSNFGEENLYPLFEKDESGDYDHDITDPDSFKANDLLNQVANEVYGDDYADLSDDNKYGARIKAMKEDEYDEDYIYHHEKSLGWEDYTVQTGQIAGDCVDLNTENPEVAEYIRDVYYDYIDMGVDGFRIDTVKHISRLTFNNEFIPHFKERGGENFFMFGEVAARYRGIWNFDNPNISVPFYTWQEEKNYPWGDTETNLESTEQFWEDNQDIGNQPTSNNHALDSNQYHEPDYSQHSGMDQIDFPMHWSFKAADNAFNLTVGTDKYYNDATWNVTYVDSHDYAPDQAPEDQRFAGSQSTWAENLSLMFTFRGIPTIYYGSEIEFKKGATIDEGPNIALEESGRAYFGDEIEGNVDVTGFGKYDGASGEISDTLSHPLAQHIRRLNLIRREVPALQKGQYSTENISGNLAFKRRYTNQDEGIDSFVLVTVSDDATFNNIPNGTYVDAVTGNEEEVTDETLTASCPNEGNARIYVLETDENLAPGKIGSDGKYLK
ncbi:MAG: alpha-amylase family glycosyl hydrolase [Halanaerobacter sp.]